MLIYSDKPQSISAETYKSIRTNLKYVALDNSIKTIAITSSVPGEGKSTIVGNLGLCLGESGNRVLIIDCDLRKPKIHRKFKCSNKLGLTDVLINNDKLGEALYEYNSRVTILPAGSVPPNPAEILGSKTFERFLRNVSIDYDYVLLDTPPLLAVTDGRLIAAKTDGTILVVRYGKTKEKLVVRAYRELELVKASVIGSIMNGCDIKSKDHYYSYYGKRNKFSRKKHKGNTNKIIEVDVESKDLDTVKSKAN
ncbi:MAG: CpsD/CapB family tyrosine-protein kinase [Clostridium sp.]|nr:CpsD/CapB family tyrosine-protein kinase [Clostridium sp.]